MDISQLNTNILLYYQILHANVAVKRIFMFFFLLRDCVTLMVTPRNNQGCPGFNT
jgi:hypothetical protein